MCLWGVLIKCADGMKQGEEILNMLDDEIITQKDQGGWNDGLDERRNHFSKGKNKVPYLS